MAGLAVAFLACLWASWNHLAHPCYMILDRQMPGLIQQAFIIFFVRQLLLHCYKM